MSTVKISELPVIPILNPDTTQTLVAGVDLVTGITGKMTAKVLATSLYSHDKESFTTIQHHQHHNYHHYHVDNEADDENDDSESDNDDISSTDNDDELDEVEN